MRPWMILLFALFVAACGVDGAPVPPGSDKNPRFMDDFGEVEVDPMFD